MVPLSAVTSVKSIAGPEFTMRYNEYHAAQINASAAPGYSSGQAMKALEDTFAATMPREMGFDYIGHVLSGAAGREGRLHRRRSSDCRCCLCF